MLRSVIRDMTSDEVSDAIEGALAAVSHMRVYDPDMSNVVRITATYGLTSGAVSPHQVEGIDCSDKQVSSIIIAVSHWLRYDYHGVAEFGLWERTRYLIELAQSS